MTFIERFSNYEVKNIDTSGFDELTANEQHLLYHLSMAGNVARNIIYHQTSTYSLAAKEVLKYGYSELRLEKVLGLTAEQNLGSIRILEKLGFKFEEKFLFNNKKALRYLFTRNKFR